MVAAKSDKHTKAVVVFPPSWMSVLAAASVHGGDAALFPVTYMQTMRLHRATEASRGSQNSVQCEIICHN